MQNAKQKSQLTIVKETLAQQLGIEPDDISYEDLLSEDFHMRATDIVDFLENINSKGVDTAKLDLPNIHSFGDLIQALDIEYEL